MKGIKTMTKSEIKCPNCKRILENWDVCVKVEAYGYINRGGETDIRDFGDIELFYCSNCGKELPEKVVDEYLYTE